MRVESVVFKGITFRRYPDSKRAADRNYFKPGGQHIMRGVESLHREIWKAAKGPIPRGFHVHHMDEDTGHNEISNYELLPGREHLSRHGKSRPLTQKQIEHLAEARELTKAWHASPEGREWHRQHGKEAYAKRTLQDYICTNCGAGFQSLNTSATNTKFCTNACKSDARRKSGVDKVTKTCPVCGREFGVSKYLSVTCCSKSCAGRYRGIRTQN